MFRTRLPRTEVTLEGTIDELDKYLAPRVVDGGVTATGVLSRERGNLITICNTL